MGTAVATNPDDEGKKLPQISGHLETFVLSRIRTMKTRGQTVTFDSLKAMMPDGTPLQEVIDWLVLQGKLTEKEETHTVFSIT